MYKGFLFFKRTAEKLSTRFRSEFLSGSQAIFMITLWPPGLLENAQFSTKLFDLWLF